MRNRVVLMMAALALSPACATRGAHKPAQPLSQRAPERTRDSAPERVAAVNEASGVGEPEAVEERFAAQAAKERRERTKSTAPGKGQGRVEVSNQKTPPPPPAQ